MLEEKPDWVLVVGDVNSTIACALVCCEARHQGRSRRGGASFSVDRSMPEEINRILTDSISDLLLTTSQDADENLQHEGIPLKDPLRRQRDDRLADRASEARRDDRRSAKNSVLTDAITLLLTLHRPSNVDDAETLTGILDAL